MKQLTRGSVAGDELLQGLRLPCNCELSGERGRNRTYNLLIKSQLLCQLSYAPVLLFSIRCRELLSSFE